MSYDFKTLIDRTDMGSTKWLGMRKENPKLPEGIIPFSTADMEFKNAPEITEGLQEFLKEAILGYATGTESYYEALIGWMERRHNYHIQSEWVTPAEGVITGYVKLIKTVTEPGDGVIIMSPVYYPFRFGIMGSGREVVENQLIHNEDGTYEIDFDDLREKAKQPRTRALLFCNPHNPVGRVWTKQELCQVAEICLENDVFIISDEIHQDLIMPGYSHTVMATISPEVEKKCAVCTAPSKTFNMAGMKHANIIIADGELTKKYRFERMQDGYMNASILGYKACEIAYSKGEAWLDELISVLDDNRKFVNDFIYREIPQIKVSPLEGTYLMWLDCHAFHMDNKEMERFMKEDALIYGDEGYMFGSGGDGFERINIACPQFALEQALIRLKTALEMKNIL